MKVPSFGGSSYTDVLNVVSPVELLIVTLNG